MRFDYLFNLPSEGQSGVYNQEESLEIEDTETLTVGYDETKETYAFIEAELFEQVQKGNMQKEEFEEALREISKLP
jgi:hypothetical protein